MSSDEQKRLACLEEMIVPVHGWVMRRIAREQWWAARRAKFIDSVVSKVGIAVAAGIIAATASVWNGWAATAWDRFSGNGLSKGGTCQIDRDGNKIIRTCPKP